MNETSNWIYVDYRKNIWKFSLNDNKKLFYKIMYSEGKWKKESLIDVEVLSFSIYIDENEQIHLVYSNTKGELRYCTIKENEWLGKTIYKIENNNFEINNIKIKMIDNEMNIFYLLVENDGSDHGILMHCRWSGKKIKFSNIQDIIVIPSLKDHYSVHVNNDYQIDLFFITDEGDEVSLNYHSFENYIWSPRKRLYGIQGKDIGFEVLIDKDDFHILNKSKENEMYFLDYVFLDSTGQIEETRVCESKKNLEYPMLAIEDDKLICCWIKENKVSFSIYDGEKWGDLIPFNRNNELELELNNAFYYLNEQYIKEKKVYVTKGLDLYMFNPEDFFKTDKTLRNNIIDKHESFPKIEERKTINNLTFELSKVNAENKNLVNKNNYLNKQLQNTQKTIREYDQKILKISNKKLKAEKKYDELLEKENKEKENSAKRLLEEKTRIEIIEKKLKEIEAEKILLKEKYESLEEELYTFSEENKKLKLDIGNINGKNKKLDMENTELREESRRINELALKVDSENISLNKENKRIIEYNENLFKEKEMVIKRLLEEKTRIEIIEIKSKEIEAEKILLKEKYESLEEELYTFSEENKKLKLDIDNISGKNKKLSMENTELREENRIINELALKVDSENITLNKENKRIIEYNENLVKEKEMLIKEQELLIKDQEMLIEEQKILVEERKKLIKEKMILIEEKINLIEENEKLNEELELEKNQSVMDRLLKRRIN